MIESQSSRRHFLASQSTGMASLALAWLMQQDTLRAAPPKPELNPTYDLTPKTPPGEPRAKAMISLFMQGGPSHLDMFDPKPELDKRDGQKYAGEIKVDSPDSTDLKLMKSKWAFSKHGQCGMELSSLVPHLGEVADEISLIRSMHTGVNNHGQSVYALATGRVTVGRPSLGSWVTYALGSENENLPAFVALTDPENLPIEGARNWSNGWLPSIYQGTIIRPREPRILNLDPPPHLKGAGQEQFIDYIGKLNRRHFDKHPGEMDLSARIASYELAARMQVSAKEALDLSGETEATKKMYGLDEAATKEYGSRCLIARRLIERGVRFVQLFTSQQKWDHHSRIHDELPAMCLMTDKPAAALIKDLKQRGLLDTTLVHWGGEMGRMPVIQSGSSIGRDHNTFGFSQWMAGGGIRGGYVHGKTDEFGINAVENVVNHYDYHATLLHLFGLDHAKVTFERGTGPGSLTDGQPARVVKELLA